MGGDMLKSMASPILAPLYGRPTRRRFNERAKLLVAAFLLTFLFYTYMRKLLALHSACNSVSRDLSKPRIDAGNMTLGFSSILALSVRPSWRTRGLIAAAQFTGLDIQIPKQPHITDEMVTAFKNIESPNGKQPSTGSAYAWLAHIDMIKHAVINSLETVLIVEDDVDWDVDIKSSMQLISDNVRLFTKVNSTDTSPYGHNWDILWIGHCGEHTEVDTHRIEFSDPTVPARDRYTGWANKYLYNIDAGKRAIQHGANPVCSFGYALTLKGAERVLAWAGKGGNEAFDIKLLQGCQSKDLDCLVVTPEVMHHYQPPKELGYTSLVAEEDGKGVAADEHKYEHSMGGTENIAKSTRCKVLFGTTCMKDHRDYWYKSAP